jgi:hypothetical protein
LRWIAPLSELTDKQRIHFAAEIRLIYRDYYNLGHVLVNCREAVQAIFFVARAIAAFQG